MSDSRASSTAEHLEPLRSIRVTTGSRLHFGLLDIASPFGGVGVMIDSPQTRVTVRPNATFDCSAKFEARIIPILQRIRRWKGLVELPSCRVEVEQAAPSHFGLGSGTQISLAVAEGVCRSMGLVVEPNVLISELRRVDVEVQSEPTAISTEV